MDIISPKIAVIVPVYNGEKTIEKSINSLRRQTFQDWVCVIVNDGSTDNTLQVLDEIDDNRFIIITYPDNKGRGYARNTALDKLRELDPEYMCMLDADDLYYPDKLEWQYSYMSSHPHITLSSSTLGFINDKLELTHKLDSFADYTELYFNKFDNYISVPHGPSIIRFSDIGEISYNNEFLFAQDQDFMIRLLISRNYSYIPRIGYLYNREASFSLHKYYRSLIFNIRSRRNVSSSKFFFTKYCILSFVKLAYVAFLCLLGKEKKYYLDKIGESPKEQEIRYHKDYLKTFLSNE